MFSQKQSVEFAAPASHKSVSVIEVLLVLAIASGLINLFALTGSVLMIQIYDRVLPSQSLPTLFVLAILALGFFVAQMLFDVFRSRLVSRVASELERKIGPRLFASSLQLATAPDGLASPLRDLEVLRNFVGSGGVIAFFDLPWIPIYLFACFKLHAALGGFVTLGALVLVMITAIAARIGGAPSRAAADSVRARAKFAAEAQRKLPVISSMRFGAHLEAKWVEMSDALRPHQIKASDAATDVGAITRAYRLALQSMVLVLGAYLVLRGGLIPSAIFASALLTSRALSPVELSIGNWRGLMAARGAWGRISALLHEQTSDLAVQLPPPCSDYAVRDLLVVTPPSSSIIASPRALLNGLKFVLQAGDCLAVIGPNGAGKSVLAAAMVGSFPIRQGDLRLDGAALDQWDPKLLGRHIGYLPQEIHLFEATVAENISRFDDEADATKVINAAKLAGIHDVILQLPNGYETILLDGGATLPAGHRQQIGLARAFYGDPFLVVLDEPNAYLDGSGDEMLTVALMAVRARAGIAVLVTHRPSALAAVNKVLMLTDGKQRAFGNRDDVLGDVLMRPARVEA